MNFPLLRLSQMSLYFCCIHSSMLTALLGAVTHRIWDLQTGYTIFCPFNNPAGQQWPFADVFPAFLPLQWRESLEWRVSLEESRVTEASQIHPPPFAVGISRDWGPRQAANSLPPQTCHPRDKVAGKSLPDAQNRPGRCSTSLIKILESNIIVLCHLYFLHNCPAAAKKPLWFAATTWCCL